MNKSLIVTFACLVVFVSSCTKSNNETGRDSLAVADNQTIESVNVTTLGLVTTEADKQMIGQDVVYKNGKDTYTLSFRRSLPKTGEENIMLMVYYDKIPVATPVSSLDLTFSDGSNFSIDADAFFPLKSGQFDNQAGKDSGKKIQGLSVIINSLDRIKLKNSDIASIKTIFQSGDQVTATVNTINAQKIRDFLNQSYKDTDEHLV